MIVEDLQPKDVVMGSWVLYAVCFLSGMAALMYEVVWFRSLSLVFGGSHLAVTTTVAVFMGGLALGNWLSARYLGRSKNLLRLYGLLELGIAASAGMFLVLFLLYPHVYPALARLGSSPWYLTLVRVLFGTVAMAAPTTLMGATLPVLTGALAETAESVGVRLSVLYGLNTLGGILGVAGTGFYLIPSLPVSRITYLAMALNAIAGLTGLLLSRKTAAAAGLAAGPRPAAQSRPRGPKSDAAAASGGVAAPASDRLPYRLVLWGVGVSGFCALGYEILWTRILILFTDASVYSFTVVLSSFLGGIGIGGLSYGIFRRIAGSRRAPPPRQDRLAIAGFGLTQLGIGLVTILLMHMIFDLPSRALRLMAFFYRLTGGVFSARQFGNLALASSLLFVPSFLMGLAVPIAGKVHARHTSRTGAAVGEVFAYNTVGAILGAAVSGFALIYLAGIERSLGLLALINAGLGILILASATTRRRIVLVVSVAAFAAAALLAWSTGILRSWDVKYLATYTHNQAPLYGSREATERVLGAREVLYYAEGSESIVSSVRNRQSQLLSFTVNGRVEASTELEDVQNQYMLGHLPMLLHDNPRKVLVVGAGSGMTLGAVSVHPSVESVVLAEIEPKVLGVVRSFGAWNHEVLDNPKLEVVLNDGRNFLLTTRERYDVITADPIHPSWRGAGYLYTSEYFALAASRLAPGGVMCQWLPLYQLTVEDLRSVIGTFARSFRYVQAWLTLADVQLVGSDSPLLLDERKLRQRLSAPPIARDFRTAVFGDVEDFYTYFLMGTEGVSALGRGAIVNTDENVYLEFSSPRTIGDDSTAPRCLKALQSRRESIERYLRSPAGPAGGREALARDAGYHAAAERAHLMVLSRQTAPLPGERESAGRALMAVPDRGLWKSLRLVLGFPAGDAGTRRPGFGGSAGGGGR